jgi:CRP-like cAMP-binding protein
MATCKAITKDGKPCRGNAQKGRDTCFFHDPEKTEAVKAAQVKGGTSIKVIDPKVYKPWRGTPGDMTVMRSPGPGDVVNLLADTIDEVKTGLIDPRIATAVGYLAGMIIKALEVEALDERLAAIEDAVGVKR